MLIEALPGTKDGRIIEARTTRKKEPGEKKHEKTRKVEELK